MIYGWHLVEAVCPPMAPRNKCTCRTGDHEIQNGEEIELHHGQSVYTLVERSHKAVAPDTLRERQLIGTAAARRASEWEPPVSDEGDYPGVAEFTPGARSSEPTMQLSLASILPEPTTRHTSCIAPLFPAFIEVPMDYRAVSIEDELGAWGFPIRAFVLAPHDVAFCVPHDWQVPEGLFHYAYVHTDTKDADGVFIHTSTVEMKELDHMKLLHQFGYNRAAILACDFSEPGLCHVLFQDAKAGIAPHKRPLRTASPWPAPQPRQWNRNAVTDRFQGLPDGDGRCRLAMHRTCEDVIALLNSSTDILCTDTSYLDLSDEVRTAVASISIAASGQTYDRLVIYISKIAQNHS